MCLLYFKITLNTLLPSLLCSGSKYGALHRCFVDCVSMEKYAMNVMKEDFVSPGAEESEHGQ